MEKAMDQVRKENFNVVFKHLHVYGPILGEEFLEQVQMHYDMSFKLEMLTKKLQMGFLGFKV